MMAKELQAYRRSTRQSGQTLIIAIIILGVLMILGIAFTVIIGNNIGNAGRSKERTVASDLASAGVQFAHSQLQTSASGADWRPAATPPTGTDANGRTRDPDALYLRPGSGLQYPGTNFADLGGPDGLGPYARIDFERGRALIRVRYAPSDYDAFANPTGVLRRPGRAKYYLIIEAVGRPGTITTNGRIDPNRLLKEAVRIKGFADAAEFAAELGRLKNINNLIADTRKLMAFASIGIIEHGRYITNVDKLNKSAEIGILNPTGAGGIQSAGMGVLFHGVPVTPTVEWGGQIGITLSSGSLWSNASLIVHGSNHVYLNVDLGDMWAVAGTIKPANGNASLGITRGRWNPATAAYDYLYNATDTSATPFALGGGALDSDSPGFNTVGGVVRDGKSDSDAQGYVRGIAYKAPPAIDLNRYRDLTRNSGPLVNGNDAGRAGFGHGVYCDSAERANLATETDREVQGAIKSLPNDWLNPNNPNSQGWQGPFYRPLSAYLRLTPDGFEIIRDSRSKRRYWTNPVTGQRTTSSRVRFRLRTRNGETRIMNDIVEPDFTNRAFASVSDQDFYNHSISFNGVLCFEGDVRVRGVIPTNQQLTVVANGTIYIDGSITKGIVSESGGIIATPSRSMIALLAKDYVTVNTTQFFAPGPGDDPKPKNGDRLPDTPNPIELDLAESKELNLFAQFLLDPSSATSVGDPSTASPYALTYAAGIGGASLMPNLLLTSSADDNGPAFLSIDISPLTFADPSYTAPGAFLFPTIMDFGSAGAFSFNAADNLGWGTAHIPVYGLGNPDLNAYPKFETIGFPLFSGTTYSNRQISSTGNTGSFKVAVQDETQFKFKFASVGAFVPKNFLFARAAIAPFDVRIEAAMFAENGSFFVIPGHWFNSNVSDSREAFEAEVAATNMEAAQRRRFETYGNTPSVPFYGEPLDVKVTIVGAVSENMPAPISQQAEWMRKWGWIPKELAATNLSIPRQHVPKGMNLNDVAYVPNLVLNYDPALATATSDGVLPIRRDADGWILPPMPRLPVSPTLAYYGEVNP